MRVRIYELGAGKTVGVHYLDQFPCTVNVDEEGCLSDEGRPVCQLEDLGGEILYRAMPEEETVMVNDAALEYGPLIPGDQLVYGSCRFMISYERTATPCSPESKYRFQE